ncbi:ATP-binding protein [Marinobacterium sp. BA1]|uniref:GAF domain-containing sensor histidine kinase n=1 Tax=Marinobacterium sp. BA1 TaxID=3138931 RepID=UPI0032E56676
MELIVFYQLNGYFIALSHEKDFGEKVFIPESKLIDIPKNSPYLGGVLNKKIGNFFNEKSKYILIEKDREYLFYKSTFFTKYFLGDTEATYNFLKQVNGDVVSNFRHEQKEKLLFNITRKDISLHDYLKKLSEYVFCEHFSLWSYNSLTNFFTCEATSLEEACGYLISGDACRLSDVLDDKYKGFEARSPYNDCMNSDILGRKKIKSVNRIKLDIGFQNKTPVVVNFYSEKEGFYLGDSVVTRLKRLVETKYIESIQLAEEQFGRLTYESLPNIEKESLEVYLKRFCKLVSEILLYEACSVFIKSEENLLVLTASFDKEGFKSNSDIVYPLNVNSLTTKVAKSKKIYCSYDLEKEHHNSHIYDEKTKNKGKNWVGIPIEIGNELVGVVRVKNKYVISGDGKRTIKPPRPVHFDTLQRAKVILESSIDIYYKYNDLNKKLEAHDNFNRVLLHEIRTPISKFNTGPEIIKRGLSRENIPEDKKRKYISQLEDIQVLGGRLKLLTDSYYFDELIKLRKRERISLLQGIIYPIVNITKPYLEKQHDCFVYIDMGSMHSWYVVGDRDLYTIALNALVDNAAKYCDDVHQKIVIDCKHDFGEDYLYVSVKNRGIPINKAERKKIFEDGYRGKKVLDEKIHGTGIGLFLAKNIMIESGGDLLLVPHSDPKDIEFTLKFPVPKNMEY